MRRFLLLLVFTSLAGMDNPWQQDIDDTKKSIKDIRNHYAANHENPVQKTVNHKGKGIRMKSPILIKSPPFYYKAIVSPLDSYVLTLTFNVDNNKHLDDFEVYDARNGEFLHRGTIDCEATQFSPNDRYLAISEDEAIDILESQTGKLVHEIRAQFPLISTDITFLPGDLVAYPDVAPLIPSDDFENPEFVPKGFVTIFIDLIKEKILGSIPGRKFEYCKSGYVKFERTITCKPKSEECRRNHSPACTSCTKVRTGYSYYTLPALKPLTLPDQSLGLKEEVQLPAPLSLINDNLSVQIAPLKALGTRAKK